MISTQKTQFTQVPRYPFNISGIGLLTLLTEDPTYLPLLRSFVDGPLQIKRNILVFCALISVSFRGGKSSNRRGDTNNMSEETYKIFWTPEQGVNVALAENGAKMVKPDMKPHSLNEDLETFSSHTIGKQGDGEDGGNREGIVIELGDYFLLNRIKFLLRNKDDRSYSYYLELSMNGKNWTRICDYSMYLCRSWQFIGFSEMVTRFIKIVGTHSTRNDNFHVVTIHAFLAPSELHFDRKWNLLGLLVPRVNVAVAEIGAKVIRGKGGNKMINGDITRHHDNYTYQDVRDRPIVLQLSQPFILDSMRLLLWDNDDRVYSYEVNVSTNLVDWETIARRENERSWQDIRFPPVPVVFIWILGSRMCHNDFHVIHFECPVQQTAASSEIAA